MENPGYDDGNEDIPDHEREGDDDDIPYAHTGE